MSNNSSIFFNLKAIERLGFSARSYYRILRVARTIADLEIQPQITTQHLAEAVSFRKLNLTDKT